MAVTNDGFVIAERDLKLRGPGDFFGTRQSGLPQLRAGDLTRDVGSAGAGLRRGAATRRRRHADRRPQEYVQSVWQRQFGLITVG